MSDYTLRKERNYLVGGKREIRDTNERLVGYANDLNEAQQTIERKDGGKVKEEK